MISKTLSTIGRVTQSFFFGGLSLQDFKKPFFYFVVPEDELLDFYGFPCGIAVRAHSFPCVRGTYIKLPDWRSHRDKAMRCASPFWHAALVLT
jgi:hypothetical protein